MNWKSKLKIWVDQGFLDRPQVDKILEFENSRKTPYAFYSFLALGIFVISLGVIALIASHWNEIHYSIKLILSFAILGALAFLVLYSEKKGFWNDTIRTLLLLLFAFLCLAQIGLISQIYHTQGKFYEATGLWVCIIFLLLIFFPSRLLIHLWILAFVFSWYARLFDVYSGVLEEHWLVFSSLILSWIFGLSSLLYEKKIGSGEDKRSIAANPFLLWYFIFFLTACVAGTFATHSWGGLEEAERMYHDTNFPFPAWVLVLVPTLLSGLAFRFKNLYTIRKSILYIGAGVILTLLNYPQFTGWYGRFPAVIYFFAAWLFFTFVFFESRRWFDLCLVVAGLRFVFIYFEVFGSLLDTGLGLIVSGIVILAFSIGIYRLREKIRIMANRLFALGEE